MIQWLMLNIGLLLVAYILGATPTGYWVGQWLYGVDLRSQGSGSTGATNVLRNCGKLPALFVVLVDVLKGTFAIALARFIYSLSWTQQLTTSINFLDLQSSLYLIATIAGLCAIIGHTKSFWIEFKGGKAVATSLGVLLAFNWVLALATLGVFCLTLAISRIVSLSSIVGAITMAVLMIITAQPLPYQIFSLAAGSYIIWRHQKNIQRLLKGIEPRIGQKLTSSSIKSTQ
ncbi:MAG: glycerol-3-phosphate 1-O-acyltransferase PlsY [Microcoleaceae cyanobacterium]